MYILTWRIGACGWHCWYCVVNRIENCIKIFVTNDDRDKSCVVHSLNCIIIVIILLLLHIETWAGGSSDMQGCSVPLVTLQVKRIMFKSRRTEYQMWCIRITTASNSATVQLCACTVQQLHVQLDAYYIGVYCTCMHGLTELYILQINSCLHVFLLLAVFCSHTVPYKEKITVCFCVAS